MKNNVKHIVKMCEKYKKSKVNNVVKNNVTNIVKTVVTFVVKHVVSIFWKRWKGLNNHAVENCVKHRKIYGLTFRLPNEEKSTHFSTATF